MAKSLYGIGLAVALVSAGAAYCHGTPAPVQSQAGTKKGAPRRITTLIHRPAAPVNLELLASAPLIVIGTTTRVYQVRTSPIGDTDLTDWLGNRTVFWVRVEKYLKGMGPKSIKVSDEGGIANGIEQVIDDTTLMKVRHRYILFLRNPDEDPRSRRLGYVPAYIGNRRFVDRYLDEYPLNTWAWGKLDVTDGTVRPCVPKGREEASVGPGAPLLKIIGQPAERVVADIRAAIMRLKRMEERVRLRPPTR